MSCYLMSMKKAILAKELRRSGRWCRKNGYMRLSLECYTKAAYLMVEAREEWKNEAHA